MGGGERRDLASATVLLGLALLLGLIAVAVLLVDQMGGGPSPPDGKTAAIVDQLGLTSPGPEFVESAAAMLAAAGYKVDYFPGEEVTVSFYRSLPERGYDLVLLRAHSGRIVSDDLKALTDDVTIFSGESFVPGRYEDDVRARALIDAYYSYEATDPLFGITAEFVRSSMNGRFDGTLIIMMGCDGLRSQRIGQGFLDRGASAFVSWSKPVSASHTDATTQELLEKLFLEGLDAATAVSETAAEVGPDPFYEAELRILADLR